MKTRSGAFWLFHEKMRALRLEGRAPRVIVLENVAGCSPRMAGGIFAHWSRRSTIIGYQTGALTLDARCFTPQSRPRVFFVAVQRALSRTPRGRTADPVRAGAALDARRPFSPLRPRCRKNSRPTGSGGGCRSRRGAIPSWSICWRIRPPTRRGVRRGHRALAVLDGARPSPEDRGDPGQRPPQHRRRLSPHPRRTTTATSASAPKCASTAWPAACARPAAAARGKRYSRFMATPSARACCRRAKRRG